MYLGSKHDVDMRTNLDVLRGKTRIEKGIEKPWRRPTCKLFPIDPLSTMSTIEARLHNRYVGTVTQTGRLKNDQTHARRR